MPLSESWRDQYDRMLRSRIKLAEAAGPSSLGSDEARDRLYHFFQDAYHLKEWIKNSPTGQPRLDKAGAVVEDLFAPEKGAPVHMRIAADLCNGIKHLRLDGETKTGDPCTTFTRQDATARPATVRARADIPDGGPAPAAPPAPPSTATGEHRWYVTSNSATLDAVQLANDVVSTWTAWLQARGLL